MKRKIIYLDTLKDFYVKIYDKYSKTCIFRGDDKQTYLFLSAKHGRGNTDKRQREENKL